MVAALAVLLAHVRTTARQEIDFDHGQGDPGRILVRPSGNGVEPGTVVRLAAPKGDFRATRSGAAKITVCDRPASGITPVIAMLRTLQKRGQHADIVTFTLPAPPTR